MSYPLTDPYLAQSLAAYTLRPGIDYDPAVCDNCGEDEHTPEQLAACIDSMLGPPREEPATMAIITRTVLVSIDVHDTTFPDPGALARTVHDILAAKRTGLAVPAVRTKELTEGADAVWLGLSLAAKQTWLDAMMPQPAEPELPLITQDVLNAITTEYVKRVRANTGPDWDATANVLAAIRNQATGDGVEAVPYDIIMELSDTAHDLGIDAPDYDADPEGTDRFNDTLERLLPAIERLLSGGSEPETYGENPCIECGGTDLPLHTDGRCARHEPPKPADYVPACPECGEPDLPLHGEHE